MRFLAEKFVENENNSLFYYSSLRSRSSIVFLTNLNLFMLTGVLVQLVRIHACHAWGHEFESRTHRKQSIDYQKLGELGHMLEIDH